MRTRVAALVALLLSAAAPFTARSAAEPIDWVVASMKVATPLPPPATPGNPGGGSVSIGDGDSVSIEMVGRGRSTGTGPTLLGFGFGIAGNPFVPVADLGNGGIRFRTTSDLGEIDVEVTPVGEESFEFGVGFFSLGGSPSGSIAALLFAANGVIEEYEVKTEGGTAEITTGSGSAPIYVAGPGTSGIAADASVAFAGASGYAATTTAGIVGGPVLDECTRCTIEWTSPDGEQGSADLTNLIPHGVGLPPIPVPVPIPIPIPVGLGGGDLGFAGPAGEWSWSWTGAGVRVDPSTAVVGAYAPVGASWALLAGEHAPSPAPAPAQPPPPPSKPGSTVRGEKLAATGVATTVWGPALIVLAMLSFRGLRVVR